MWTFKDLAYVVMIAFVFIYAVAYGISLKQQTHRCIRLGYPRAMNAGILWPEVRCIKLVNGTEQVAP